MKDTVAAWQYKNAEESFSLLGWSTPNPSCYKCASPIRSNTAWVSPAVSIWDRSTGRWTRLLCKECFDIVEAIAAKGLDKEGEFQR